MREELVTIETAKLAKEKGFDWECQCSYNTNNSCEKIELCIAGDFIGRKYFNIEDVINYEDIDIKGNRYKSYLAPSQSILQKWLREKHNIIISINPECEFYVYDNIVKNNFKYDIIIHNNKKMINNDMEGNTYEEALEEGLKYALKSI